MVETVVVLFAGATNILIGFWLLAMTTAHIYSHFSNKYSRIKWVASDMILMTIGIAMIASGALAIFGIAIGV